MDNATEIGKAYRAFEAYNFKAKLNRLPTFELKRWLKVVKAIEGKPLSRAKHGTASGRGKASRKWSNAQYTRYYATIDKRRAANGHA